MKRETLFLKAVIILIALPVLALCAWGLPSIIKEATDTYPAAWVFSLLVIMYLSAIPYFWALVQAYRLLSYIDKNEAFSELSVRALRWIKYCGAAISILYAASEPFLYLIAERDDAPGLILMGMIVIFASFVIAVFAAVLEKLLKNAIDIKSENDLTV